MSPDSIVDSPDPARATRRARPEAHEDSAAPAVVPARLFDELLDGVGHGDGVMIGEPLVPDPIQDPISPHINVNASSDQRAGVRHDDQDTLPSQAPRVVLEYLQKYEHSDTQIRDLLALIRTLCTDLLASAVSLPTNPGALHRAARCSSRVEGSLICEELEPNGPIFARFRLKDVLEDMLDNDPECRKIFEPGVLFDGSTRLVGDIHTADWFTDVCRKVAPKKPLAIILYLDGIAVDFFGRIALTPIFLSLANYNLVTRESAQGKRLLGFIPSVRKTDQNRATYMALSR